MSSIENISPAVLKRISKELATLQNEPPEGIKIIINEDNIVDIQAYIQGPEGTPYDGGCFRVKIVLSTDFPSSPPKCFFVTRIFHPNVAKTGEVCVNTLKKDWKRELGIAHILLTVKCLLIVPNPESALNEEAGKLLLERYDDYAKHAKIYTSIHASGSKDVFQLQNDNASSSTNPNSASHPCSPKCSGSPVVQSATANSKSETQDKEGMKPGSPKKRLNTEKSKQERKKVDTKKRGLKRL